MTTMRIPALLAASALLLAACARDEAAGPGASANPLLAYVPADTPYAFANLEPLPPEVVDATLERAGPMLEEAQKFLDDIRIEVNADDPSGEEKMLALAGALLAEFDGKLNRAGLESLGIKLEAHQAIYGNGLFPVVRVELLDADAFRATIDRVETRAGMELPEFRSGAQRYWRIGADEGRLGVYVAVIGNHLAVTAFPAAAEAEALPEFLGQAMPDVSLAESPLLPDLNREKGFSSHGSGYVDFNRVLDEVFDPAARTAGYVALLTGYDPADIDPLCVADARRFTAVAPRAVTGITEWTTHEMGMRHQLEIRQPLAGELMELVSDVPTAPSDPDSVLSMSLAVEVGKLREFLLARATALSEQPFACPQLGDLNLRIRTVATRLNQPMPPFIGNLKGFRALLASFEPDNFQPENARGLLSLEMESPQMVIGMASMMIPGFEDLGIEPGAEPVRVPQELLSVVTPEVEVHAVMTKDAIGLAMGSGYSGSLVEFMDASGDNRGTFLSVEYDMPALIDLQHRHFARQDTTAENDPGRALIEAYRAMVGRNRLELGFTEEGLTIEQRQTFEP